MKKTPKTKAGLIGIALSATLLLAACGSDDSSSSASVDSSSETEAAAGSDTIVASDGATTTGTLGSNFLGSYELMDEEFDTMVSVVVDGTARTIEANAMPDHETGEFPNDGNPNTISEQDVSYEYTTEPTYTGSATPARTTGVAVNGVKFEPGTAETVTCSTGENYRIEALQDTYNLGLDFNNAHVQPTGEYHYHGASELLVEAYESDDDLVHVGFAADGFLMYYSKSGAYESGYELTTTERSGEDCAASGPNGETFDVEGSSPDGTYTSDWLFDESNGDLDSCNGITIDGEYVYLVTDAYPYIGRCLNGEAAAEAGGGAPPAGGGEEAGEQGAPAGGQAPGGAPDLSETAATLGISEADLREALGGPPPDIEAAAEALGISADELRAALPEQAAPGQG